MEKKKSLFSVKKYQCVILCIIYTFFIFFTAPISEAQTPAGPLRVSADGRFLTYGDGSPFFFLGDTGYRLFDKLNQADVDHYLTDRASKGFNVITTQIISWGAYGARYRNPYGYTPFVNNDPNLPNDLFFQHVDYVVNKAQSLGIYLAIYPCWGDKYGTTESDEIKIFNQTQAYNYAVWLGNRYKNKNIIWIVGGDFNPQDAEDYACHRAIANGLRSVIGSSQLMTYHPAAPTSSSRFYHDENWLDFNMMQTGHFRRDNGSSYNMVTADYKKIPVKPTLDVEPRYDNHPVGWDLANGRFNDYDARQAGYWSVMAGALGYNYGHYDIYRFWNGTDVDSDATILWKDAIQKPGSFQMSYLKKLFTSRPFLTLVPDQSLIASGQGTGADYMTACRGNDYAFVYVSTGNTVGINMGKISGTSVKGWWYNPRTGQATAIGTFSNTGIRTFDAPGGTPGRGNDWILVLDDIAKNYPAPGGALVVANKSPQINIASPTTGTTYDAPASMMIQANATDTDGSIAKVEFYAGTTKIGEATASPYSYTWSNVAAGNYSITAKATDDKGATATSTAASVSVQAPNQLPQVSLVAPTANATFTAPASITIQASATDADGSIAKVEFYAGTTKIGEATASPYSYIWSNVAAGNYSITAKATDNEGGSITSSSVQVAVVNPPDNALPQIRITAPAPNAAFTVPANLTIQVNAEDSDGGIAKVEFFAGGIKLGESNQSPYSFTWNSVTAGTHKLTAKATDNQGATALSNAVPVTVNNLPDNQAPSVVLVSPVPNASFAAPASMMIQANATDADGSIAKVEFYAGTTKIGERTSSPYSYTWSNVAAGNYSITAKATDDKGAVTNTSAIGVSVVATALTGCPGTGTITREVWHNVEKLSIASLPLNTTPNRTQQLSAFDSPVNVNNHYGARIRGYLCPPVSGEYTFWIAADEQAELWLSTDDKPVNKVKIAWVDKPTGYQEWEKYTSQRSVRINLQAGNRYYVEALQLEDLSNDHLSVGWSLPNGTMERPIPGLRLIPIESAAEPSTSTFLVLDQLNLHPNPAETKAVLEFETEEPGEVSIALINRMIQQVSTKHYAVARGSNQIEINVSNLPNGLYFITVNGLYTKKLVVAR